MRTGRSWRRRGVAAVLALGLTTTLVACGDDDDDEGASDATTTTAEAAAGDATEACEAHSAFMTGVVRMFVSLPEVPEGEAPSAEIIAAAQRAYDENVADTLEPFETNAPEEIADEVQTLLTAVRSFREAPDPSKLESDETEAAQQAVDAHFYETCEGGVRVEAQDYRFEGGEQLEAGTVRIELDNTGKEMHEYVLFKPKAGVTETLEQLFELPEDQVESKIDFVTAVDAAPGEKGYTIGELEPGTYYAVCFIPQGTTSEDAAREAEGRPHFTLGMRQEIKVS